MALEAGLLAGVLGLLGVWWGLHRRGLSQCLIPYVIQSRHRNRVPTDRPLHVLLCIADHYEPRCGRVPAAQANARVATWVEKYPVLFGRFRDSDDQPPQQSFFFPIDEYDADHVDALAGLCRAGFGEVDIHLHHDHDTAAALRQRLLEFVQRFRDRHGLLARERHTGQARYGFIHGNWALDNSRPDGRWCGVNNELDILRQTGCYADFTLPSAPSPAQTRKINSLYYACDNPLAPKSHDWGVDVGRAAPPPDSLLLIQGPLLLNWRNRKAGLLPHIENGCLQATQPPTLERLDLWLRAGVQVPARPDWFFVKLHTHGATEANQAVMLGRPMVEFHEALAQRAARDPYFHYHYVTAREMYNLVKAAEAGWPGTVAAARDFALLAPPLLARPQMQHVIPQHAQ